MAELRFRSGQCPRGTSRWQRQSPLKPYCDRPPPGLQTAKSITPLTSHGGSIRADSCSCNGSGVVNVFT